MDRKPAEFCARHIIVFSVLKILYTMYTMDLFSGTLPNHRFNILPPKQEFHPDDILKVFYLLVTSAADRVVHIYMCVFMYMHPHLYHRGVLEECNLKQEQYQLLIVKGMLTKRGHLVIHLNTEKKKGTLLCKRCEVLPFLHSTCVSTY